MVILTSSTLAKYIKVTTTKNTFIIGNKLFFNYERSDLFRNDQLIVGVETEYEENGIVHKRIETMNIMPGDNITYHFFVSNFNDKTLEYNGIIGQFIPIASGFIALPVKGETFDVDCTIMYRAVPIDGSMATDQFTLLTDTLVLPTSGEQKVKYEFVVSCILDDQLADTTSDDYFGAQLSIYLFINAASNI